MKFIIRSIFQKKQLLGFLIGVFFFNSAILQSQVNILTNQVKSEEPIKRTSTKKLTQKQREDLKRPVQLEDLAYGEILFDYYRGEEIKALTHIQVAQQNELLPHHENSAALLSGVIYLNLGMLNRAQGIFNRLLSKNDLKNELLAKIEFYLAKIQYQQNDFIQAKKRLTQTYLSLNVDLKDQALIMLSNIAVSENELSKSKKWLELVSENSKLLIFSQYNLGVLWLKQNNALQAKIIFNKILAIIEPSNVEKNIQDKSKLALGFYFLKNNNFESAKAMFLNVRLNSPFTNKALLGLGWGYVQKKQYKKALNHWLELSDKDMRDIAVQEVLIAVPFAYQKLNALQPALNLYLNASKKYQQQIDLIVKVEGEILNENLIQDLINEPFFKEKSFFSETILTSSLKEIHEGTEKNNAKMYKSGFFESDYAYYIYEMISQNNFTESVKRYHKLDEFLKILNYWEEQLPMFTEMLNINEQSFNEQLPKVEKYLQANAFQKYDDIQSGLKNDIEGLKRSEKLYLVATPEQLEIHQRIKRVEAKINKLPESLVSVRQLNKIRRAKGVLMWQLEEGLSGKIRMLSKLSDDVDMSILKMKGKLDVLYFAKKHASSRLDGFQFEIVNHSNDLMKLKNKITEQAKFESSNIKQKILNILRVRKNTLEHFLLQSDLSVARLYEQAISIKEVN